MIQKNFFSVSFAAFLAALSIVSCSKSEPETSVPNEKQLLPAPSSYTASSYWTTAEISWEPVAECEYYRCELFSGDTPQGDPVFQTTVADTVVLLENLHPDAVYTMELYACPFDDSEDYAESEALSILLQTASESTDFILEVDSVEKDPQGGYYGMFSWIPRDKNMIYFPFIAQGELYDGAASDEEYIQSYYDTIRMTAEGLGWSLEQYLSLFLKTGDFSGGSMIPEAGKYYVLAFGCERDGTPTTELYKLAFTAGEE